MRHEDNVGYKMRLIHNRIHKQMEAKRIENEGNITGMQRWTLGFLNDRADTEIYQKDIEQEFKVSRATASNMLQLMERKGLIVRESVSRDARLKRFPDRKAKIWLQSRMQISGRWSSSSQKAFIRKKQNS